MDEGEIIEMGERLKLQFEKNELELNKMKYENTYLKKILMTSYGMVRVIDHQSEIEMDLSTKGMIEMCRSYLSDMVEEVILNFQ